MEGYVGPITIRKHLKYKLNQYFHEFAVSLAHG